jgi:hypothetical protein
MSRRKQDRATPTLAFRARRAMFQVVTKSAIPAMRPVTDV